jgi:hypothetical protein
MAASSAVSDVEVPMDCKRNAEYSRYNITKTSRSNFILPQREKDLSQNFSMVMDSINNVVSRQKQKDPIHKTAGEMVSTYNYINMCVEKLYREEESNTSSRTGATRVRRAKFFHCAEKLIEDSMDEMMQSEYDINASIYDNDELFDDNDDSSNEDSSNDDDVEQDEKDDTGKD